MVAPRTGAWIEILQCAQRCNGRSGSLPARERGLKYCLPSTVLLSRHVAPRTGAWIEIHNSTTQNRESKVAPRTGAWIEITRTTDGLSAPRQSLPARERGLKSVHVDEPIELLSVAARTGAWIEILYVVVLLLVAAVAPRTGAWIEISPLAWPNRRWKVAPRTGAWIEIFTGCGSAGHSRRRSPHGSVD